MSNPPSEKNKTSESTLTIVGIGASAGGLAALRNFFAQVPEDSGLAYVVVVHLAPDHESHLAELLQTQVKMPVVQVTETMHLEANRVYVIPPGCNLNTIDTHLRLSELEERRGERAPIDHFFRTLARTHDGHAVGVILTGTGSDGTLGIKEIKVEGGLTIVQDPNEAEYDGMPLSALATGLIDLVLPLAKIYEYIHRFAHTNPRLKVPEEGDDLEDQERQLLQKVFSQIRARTGRDFSRYKRSTVLRRLRRRMQLLQIEELEVYLNLLRKEQQELVALSDEFLITVTNFFLDSKVYEQLSQELIPKIFEGKKPSERVRVWSVGCATGEEAYSLAILLLEEAFRHDEPPELQIFASDLHEHSLHKAREGYYPGDIETDVSAERLKRFFVKENSGYRIRKEIRDMVVFAPHNLLSDPPFSKIDLIVCRNVLIYLQREVQRDVIELFHYALKPEGYLLLGTAETIEGSDLFRTEHKTNCIYRKRNVPAPEPRLPVFPLSQPRQIVREQGESERELLAYGALHQRIVERYAPPSLLVSPNHNVVHLSEHVGRYLTHPGGELTSNVFKLVRSDFHIELRAALHAAKEKQQPVRTKPVAVHIEGEPLQVVLAVYPAGESRQEGFFVVLFDEQGPEATKKFQADASGSTEKEDREQGLEEELDTTRQRLQSIIEEYETGQEEMKASNEEMQSTNEELRSTMEELETSKEELQSMNEELATLNQENRHKVEELSQLSGDLQNFLAATDIATLFLDRQLRILRFTPQVNELFNVRLTDRGRPILDITHRLGYADLQKDAQRVLDKLVTLEREVQDEAERWYLMRILPYRSTEERIEGVVLTFIDITSRKQSEEALRESEEQYRALTEASAQMVWTTDAEGKVVEDSPSWRSFTGQSFEEWKGEGWSDAVHPEDKKQVKQRWQKSVQSGKMLDTLFRIRYYSGGWRWTSVRAVPLHHQDGSIRGWVGMNIDVTEHVESEKALRESEERYRTLFESIDEGFCVLEMLFNGGGKPVNYRFLETNPTFERQTGLTDTQGKTAHELALGRQNHWVETCGRVALTGKPERFAEELMSRRFEVEAFRIGEAESPRVALLFTDITERKQTEEALRQSEARFRSFANTAPALLWVTEPTGECSFLSQGWYDYTGQQEESGLGFGWLDALHPDDRTHVRKTFLAANEQQEPFRVDFRVRGVDDDYRWAIVAGQPMYDEAGVFIGFVGSVIDINDRKLAEQALRRSEERFQSAFKINTVGVIFWNTKFEISEINEGFLRMSGFSREEALGQTWQDLTPPEYHPASENAVSEIDEHGICTPYEKEYYRKDGSRWWGLFAASKLNEGEIVEFVLDITESKRAEEALSQSEERFRAFFENSALPLWEEDWSEAKLQLEELVASGIPDIGSYLHDHPVLVGECLSRVRLLDTNQAAVDLFKAPDKDSILQRLDRLIATEAWQAVADRLAAIIEGQTYYRGEELINTFTGEQRNVILIFVVLPGYEKSLKRVLVSLVDTTDIKRAGLALRRSEEHLRLILESATDYAIFTLDMDRNVTDWNTGAERIMGYTKEEILGQSADILFVPEERDTKPQQEVQKAKEYGRAVNERWHVRKDGNRFWGSGMVMPLSDGRELQGFLKIMTDSTDRRKMEEALREAKEKAERAAHAKEEFLAHMSHEIRTPLNAVVGLSNLLLQQNPAAEQLENLQTLKFSAENLKMLVNDILDFSKIQAGKVMVEDKDMNLRELLHSLQKAHQTRAAEQENELQINIDEQLPEIVRTDPLKLSQILNNLISNALKFTKQGSVTVTVTLEKQQEESLWVNFTVEDTGIGIPSDKLDTIFEVFTQADISTVRQYGGTGLGLSITKLLLELMGSDIAVESEVGKGSRFFFTLPMRTGSFGEVAKDTPILSPDQEARLRSLNVLLVEDAAVNRMVLMQYLQEWWELAPDEAENGKQAVALVRQKQFDIILMDVRMPVMDGYQATHAIRQLPEYATVPVLALTADTLQEVEKHPEASLFTDIVTKPFDAGELQRKILQYAVARSGKEEESSGVVHPKAPTPTSPPAELPPVSLDFDKLDELFQGNTKSIQQFLENAQEEFINLQQSYPQAVTARNEKELTALIHRTKLLLDMLNLSDLKEALVQSRTLVREKAADDQLQKIRQITEQLLETLVSNVRQHLS